MNNTTASGAERRLANYLGRAISGETAVHLGSLLPTWFNQTPGCTPQQLAALLLDDVEFMAVRWGTWLGTPEGALLANVVRFTLPPQYRPGEALLVEALRLAASSQHEQAWSNTVQRVSLVLVGGLISGMIVALLQ